MDFAAPDYSANNETFNKLRLKIQQSSLPADFQQRLQTQLGRLEKMIHSQGYKLEFDRELRYLEFIAGLPFAKSSDDILDLKRAAEILEKNHYGLRAVKDRILEYLAILTLASRKEQKYSKSLMFVGLVGSGKTSLAYSVAECLGRQIVRIPCGGLSSARELRGQSWMKDEAEPGRILAALFRIGVNNPLVLLDEVDRVAVEAKGDIMGVLVEILDPEQNFAFLDRYVDYPFDLSKILFIATANNLSNIPTAVLDRMEVIEMPAYSDEEKTVIGQRYLLPKVLDEAGLSREILKIEDDLWPQVVRPLGFDAGIRSLERTIESVVGKVARKVVEGNQGPFTVTSGNIGQYIL